MEPADLLAIVLGVAALIGCVNRLYVGLPPAIGMLLGALVLSAAILASDQVFHLHIMHWFRGTLDAADLPHVFLDGALALTLPRSAWRTDLLVMTYGVVVFTIVVQGLTISRFLRFAYGVKAPVSP